MAQFTRRTLLTTSLGALASATLAPRAKGASPCDAATATATLVPKGEPGTPLTVSGCIFRPDGETPAAGVILYVYQTDITGLYSPNRAAAATAASFGAAGPRLRGYLKTGADGRYSFRTIRPAPYPEGTIPAHIHTQLWGKDVPPQWNLDLLFEDDPLVPAADRTASRAAGRFANVRMPVAGPSGVLEATLNLRIKPKATRFEGGIRHGLDACGIGV